MSDKSLGAIILAAGKGKRMKSKNINKVTLPLADKPMIMHAINLLEEIKVKHIVVVIGFAKKSVMDILGNRVIFAEQPKRLGTAHAVSCGLKKIPNDVSNILVINGDDSAFYTKDTIEKLIELHFSSNASLTMLTIEKDNPFGLGRIIRDEGDKILSVVEEKDATEKQREIKEINPACYIFRIEFLKKYLNQVKKSEITGEYYLTSLINMGIQNNEIIETFQGGNLPWRGINTKDELQEAEKMFPTKIK
jgi:bifunctional UDP-N-acetylglucosamine pyrophosphorylase / glucosamine-1-phosphate N-acetyltransferase